MTQHESPSLTDSQKVEELSSAIIALVETLLDVGCPVGQALPALETVRDNSADAELIRAAEALIVDVEAELP